MNTIHEYFSQVKLPDPHSHKGQNGKLLLIGGSELFHAASKWSLDTASRFVDMVFYCSVPSNNVLIQEAKKEFWEGIVIAREDVENYISEADVVLIGPGMERSEYHSTPEFHKPSAEEWNTDTAAVVNYLVHTYPDKRWVIDAGALQMIHPSLLTKNCIITPHMGELDRLISHFPKSETEEKNSIQTVLQTGCTILLKGHTDYVYSGTEVIEVTGGSAGMTKGGTGDVLAGLVAALFTQNSAVTSTVVGSYTNKKAGEALTKTVGPFFSASDLVRVIPQVLWSELQSV